MRNLSPESSAQSKDFNLKRVLFCRGNHGRLFQQNRPKAVSECLQSLGRFIGHLMGNDQMVFVVDSCLYVVANRSGASAARGH